MSNTTFHRLTIAEIADETPDAVTIAFDIPESLRDAFAFIPGQYLTLRAEIDGADTRRSYSICSPVGEPRLRVGVKRIEGGVFSAYVKTLQAGDSLDVMPPQGRFTAKPGGVHDYLMLAAGSGITPILSIVESTLAREPESHVALCYGNRRIDSIMFRDRIDAIKDRFVERFSLVHLMSGEEQDMELFNGRLDAEKLETMATRGLIHPERSDAIYMCGPEAMTESLTAKLISMGVDAKKIHREIFTPATPLKDKPAKKKTAGDGGARKFAEVKIILNGSERRVFMDKDDDLLDVAAEAGFELPFSCAHGMCATCRCKLVSGEGEMRQNYSLQDWEMEKGFVLACQFSPRSAKIVLDFDAN